MRNLLLGAAVAGGLYWASKQPGGVKGVFNRFNENLKDIQNSPDPMGALKNKFSHSGGHQIEPATDYTPLPEHQTAG